MERWKASIGCLILVLFLGACAEMNIRPVSQPMVPASLPHYRVGDTFVFSVAVLEDTHEVIAVNRKLVIFKSPVFGILTQHIDFSNPDSWTGGITKAYTAVQEKELSGFFPLKVGNRVSGTGWYRYNSTGPYSRICTVDKQVRITVAAGDFDTFQIECVMQYGWGSGTSVESDRIWYAPRIGHFAAFIRHGRMFTLISYKKNKAPAEKIIARNAPVGLGQ